MSKCEHTEKIEVSGLVFCKKCNLYLGLDEDADKHMTPRRYWQKTGAKFVGSNEEFSKEYPDCKKEHPWTDDEGYFNKFLCSVDFKPCDKMCRKHHPPVNPLVRDFVEHFNRTLQNGKN